MSASSLKADHHQIVAACPVCANGRHMQLRPLLFDHLGGEREQLWKNGEVFSYAPEVAAKSWFASIALA